MTHFVFDIILRLKRSKRLLLTSDSGVSDCSGRPLGSSGRWHPFLCSENRLDFAPRAPPAPGAFAALKVLVLSATGVTWAEVILFPGAAPVAGNFK